MEFFSDIFTRTRNWYARYERPISSLSLFGGFLFDIITLHSVTAFWDNLWIGVHLLIVAVVIILLNREETETVEVDNPARLHFWLTNILQFFFGGLFSAYLVLYFRSGALSVSWPFLLILAGAFWANESFKEYYERLYFQISLFYLALFAFCIYVLPVVIHRIGDLIFVFSGVISLALMAAFTAILFRTAPHLFQKRRMTIRLSVIGVFVLINILYFANLIPPIPLSLKDAGVYHSISYANGQYFAEAEPWHWYDFFKLYGDFHTTSSGSAYVYSAIFSPSGLNTVIIDDWQYDDPKTNDWTDEGSVRLSVTGGRDQGFRTYSVRSGLAPGKWKVNIKTETGQVIGVVRFNVVATASPALVQETK